MGPTHHGILIGNNINAWRPALLFGGEHRPSRRRRHESGSSNLQTVRPTAAHLKIRGGEEMRPGPYRPANRNTMLRRPSGCWARICSAAGRARPLRVRLARGMAVEGVLPGWGRLNARRADVHKATHVRGRCHGAASAMPHGTTWVRPWDAWPRSHGTGSAVGNCAARRRRSTVKRR